MTALLMLCAAALAEPTEPAQSGAVDATLDTAVEAEPTEVDGAEAPEGDPAGDEATEDAEDGSEAPPEALEEPEEPEEPAEPYPLEWPGQCTSEDKHFDLEVMYYEGDYDAGLSECDARIGSAPDKDLYWLKARFMFEIGEKFQRTDTSIDKEQFYSDMINEVEKGLEIAPADPHLLFAHGVAMGRLGTTRGVLASLFMAKDVESAWLTVANNPSYQYSSIGGIEVLPCDAYHALGIYYRLVPDWWIVQLLAGTRGDLDKSIEFNEKSIECKPKEIQNWKELAATQLCIADKKNDDEMLAAGIASAERAQALTAHSDKQRVDQRHSKAMAEDPSMACEYSRDGQQDLDEKKLSK